VCVTACLKQLNGGGGGIYWLLWSGAACRGSIIASELKEIKSLEKF